MSGTLHPLLTRSIIPQIRENLRIILFWKLFLGMILPSEQRTRQNPASKIARGQSIQNFLRFKIRFISAEIVKIMH